MDASGPDVSGHVIFIKGVSVPAFADSGAEVPIMTEAALFLLMSKGVTLNVNSSSILLHGPDEL